MSGQPTAQLEKLRQELGGFGLLDERRGRRRCLGFKLDTEPFLGRTLPSLFPILPGQVNYGHSSTSGKEVGQ